ncbi:MAG: hypothetical protein NE330_01175 [Lentisphaeraceae bacterium]|nr:hypothetical protein [Lentisphaeraceae bacterium]
MNKTTIATWGVSLAAAFYAGYSTNSGNSGDANANNVNQQQTSRPGENSEGSSLILSAKSGTTKRAPRAAVVKPPVKVVIADLKSLLGDSGMMNMDMSAFAESYNLIKDLSEEELLEALGMFTDGTKNPADLMPIMLILGKYAEYNPQNAMAYYKENAKTPQDKMMLLSSVVGSWAKTDPEGAYDWYMNDKKENPSANSGMMGGQTFGVLQIFQGLAKNDMSSAIEKLKKLDGVGFESQMAIAGITGSLKTKDDFVNFFEEAKDFDNDKAKSKALAAWAMRNPEEAIDWTQGLDDEKTKKTYNRQIFNGWMNSNPQEAANWYMETADDKSKDKYVSQIVQNWSWRNPEQAMTWVEEQEGIKKEESIESIIRSSTYQNPQFAIDNLDKIKNKKKQKNITRNIYSQMRQTNKTKAEEFINNSPYKEDVLKNFKEEDLGDFDFTPF